MINVNMPKACPECNGSNFAIGYSTTSHYAIFQKNNPKSEYIVYVICKSCGLIVKQYATTPEKLE